MDVALIITRDAMLGDDSEPCAPWFARWAKAVGASLRLVIETGTVIDEIRDAIDLAARHADVVVVGTNPHAPVVEAVAAAAGVALADEPRIREGVEAEPGARDAGAPERQQARRLPGGARELADEAGGGFAFELLLDGLPILAIPRQFAAFRAMVERHVGPHLQAPESAILRCIGLTEEAIRELLSQLKPAPIVRLAMSGTYPEARLEIDMNGRAAADGVVVERVRSLLGGHLLSEGEQSLAEVVGRLCIDRGATVAVAESCTGGLLGAAFTEMAGSSAYFVGGALTYSNAEKTRALGIPEGLIARHGAVSDQVARAMAGGIRLATGATHALAITGVAGPSGGSPEKPVGTVWIALATPIGTSSTRHSFLNRSRGEIRSASVSAALDMLRRKLLETP